MTERPLDYVKIYGPGVDELDRRTPSAIESARRRFAQLTSFLRGRKNVEEMWREAERRAADRQGKS